MGEAEHGYWVQLSKVEPELSVRAGDAAQDSTCDSIREGRTGRRIGYEEGRIYFSKGEALHCNPPTTR